LTKGAHIEAREKEGWTPLHMAAHHGRAEVIEFLLAKGADIDGSKAQELAVKTGNKTIVELLATKHQMKRKMSLFSSRKTLQLSRA